MMYYNNLSRFKGETIVLSTSVFPERRRPSRISVSEWTRAGSSFIEIISRRWLDNKKRQWTDGRCIPRRRSIAIIQPCRSSRSITPMVEQPRRGDEKFSSTKLGKMPG